MAYENLRLTVPNFVRDEGYFYTVDSTNDIMYKKIDSGENAFSYPLDTNLVNSVLSLQYDGYYFYTLECTTSGYGSFQIKKWKIEDFLLKQKEVFSFVGDVNQRYDVSSFAVESYRRNFSAGKTVGSMDVPVSRVTNGEAVPVWRPGAERFAAGNYAILGPSSDVGHLGESEVVIVSGVDPSYESFTVTQPGGLVHAYQDGDPIVVATKVWVFNKYRPFDSTGNGQLMWFPLFQTPIMQIDSALARAEFKSVTASMFLMDYDYPGNGGDVSTGPREFLAYVKDTNILFLETDSSKLGYRAAAQSATQNNQRTNGTVIQVYDMSAENRTIFRLQQEAKIRTSDTTETDVNWSPQYNYQIATMERLPTSISLTADPAVIPVNEVAASGSRSTIHAYVKDQFDQPIANKLVKFTEDDSNGYMWPTQDYTSDPPDAGRADVEYVAGTTSRLVTVTASTT